MQHGGSSLADCGQLVIGVQDVHQVESVKILHPEDRPCLQHIFLSRQEDHRRRQQWPYAIYICYALF